MNIDPKKVKELILIYSELNEEYQKELKELEKLEKEDSKIRNNN